MIQNHQTKLQPSVEVSSESRSCRFCNKPLEQLVVDLGLSPLCQNQIARDDLNKPEKFYPLRAYVCDECWLVQVHEHVAGEDIFSHYAYFSSYSTSWLEHCKTYVRSITKRLGLGAHSFVVEVASNDGYLLKNFVETDIRCLGIEPATNVAKVASEADVPVLNKFFGQETAREVVEQHGNADLVIANNVLAHVPNLNDFVAGLGILLSKSGTLTVEFPHLLNLIESLQFDTIYQEHYCYFSITTLQKVFRHHGMRIYDAQEIGTHGGSLRIFVSQSDNEALNETKAVLDVAAREKRAGLFDLARYKKFAEQVKRTKWSLLEMLIELRRSGKSICCYGAPGKGNTLLNYCGIREDLIDYTVDRNPFKQNNFLPGSRIPVHDTTVIAETRPDYVLILPWNLKDEVILQLKYIRDWGGKFIVPIPTAEVVE